MKDITLCTGDGCWIRPVCEKFNRWLDNEESEYLEITPAFKNGECKNFECSEFYGG